MVGRFLHKVWGMCIEGKGIRGTCRYVWGKLWGEIDRAVGILARKIMSLTTPVQANKVFFHTQESHYCCNPKYICEALRQRNTDGQIDIVWRVSVKGKSGVPSGMRVVKFNTFRYFKELCSAKVVVSNSFLYVNVPVSLKKDQVLLQTWHGSLGIKRFGKEDIKDSKRRVQALVQTGKMTSFCLTNSQLENHSLSDTFWPNTPKLLYGHARNDLFFPEHEEERLLLRNKYFKKWGLSEDVKVAMYAPTFRDSKGFDCYRVDFERVLEALTERFGGEWRIVLRYHPSMAKDYAKSAVKGTKKHHVIEATDVLDMQELIALTDVAITDYSSWIYDFILMRKPGFIYAVDLEKYNTERGFYYPIETTPFAISTNNDELVDSILSFDDEAYQSKLEAFLEEKGCVEDGHAAERAADLICRIIAGEKPAEAAKESLHVQQSGQLDE